MSTQPQITPYPIRMEPKLRKALEDAAAANSRSLHAEIIHRLEGTLRKEDLVRSTLNLPAAPLPNGWEESFRKIINEEMEQVVLKNPNGSFGVASELGQLELLLAEQEIKSASREAQALALAVAFVDFYPLASDWLERAPHPQEELASSLQTGMAAVKEFINSFNLDGVWVWEAIPSGARIVLNPRFPDVGKRRVDSKTREETIQQLEITISQIKDFLAKHRK